MEDRFIHEFIKTEIRKPKNDKDAEVTRRDYAMLEQDAGAQNLDGTGAPMKGEIGLQGLGTEPQRPPNRLESGRFPHLATHINNQRFKNDGCSA